MNYKIKFVTIEKFLFVILLITDVCFFTLPYISNIFSSFCTYHNKKLSFIIVLLMFLLALYDGLIYKISNLKKINIFCYFALLVFITFSISIVKYHISVSNIFSTYYYYIIYILLFLVLKYYTEKFNDFYDFMIKSLFIIGIIYLIYTILSYFAYESNNLIIMNSNIQLYSYRNNHLRLVRTTDFISFIVVLSIIHFFSSSKIKKIKYLFVIIMGIFALFFVTQTRIYQIAIMVVLTLLLLKKQKGLINKILIIICISIIIYFFVDNINEFINSFYELSYSTENRLSAYSYYSKHFFDNIIIGFGFVTGSSNYYLLHGTTGEYYISDCGYIGFLAIFGLCGFVILILYFYHLIKNSKSSFINCSHRDDFMICGLVVYFLITNWSVSIMDPQRCIVGTIMVLLLEISFTNKKISKKNDMGVKL